MFFNGRLELARIGQVAPAPWTGNEVSEDDAGTVGDLDADQRELVLDRAMALDQDELDLDDLKWVVLMVLFNQPGSEAAYAWMETQMFDDDGELVH